MIIPYLKKTKNRALNIFAYIAVNIWLTLLLPGRRDRWIKFCPSCHNASCWLMWGVAHCDLCGYYKSGDQRRFSILSLEVRNKEAVVTILGGQVEITDIPDDLSKETYQVLATLMPTKNPVVFDARYTFVRRKEKTNEY